MRRSGSKIPLFLLLVALFVSATGVSAATAHSATCHVVRNHRYGKILVDPKGMTLYIFTVDKHGKSACVGECSKVWPPFLLPKGMKAPVKPKGLSGKLGTIARGGHRQVTYNGRPLYYYAKDKKSGETLGQGVGQVWFVVKVH